MLLWACILWVFAAVGVAMLPMRHQFGPGLVLLIAAPCLIVWVGVSHSWWGAAFAVFAFVSMFRRPLLHLWGKWRGATP